MVCVVINDTKECVYCKKGSWILNRRDGGRACDYDCLHIRVMNIRDGRGDCFEQAQGKDFEYIKNELKRIEQSIKG